MKEAEGPDPGIGEGRRFRVEGRVQGVGFRWWTAREAGRRGIRGWVRNLGDGSVEVLAWGAAPLLDDLGDRLQEGPAGARVLSVQVLELEPAVVGPPGAGFEIRG